MGISIGYHFNRTSQNNWREWSVVSANCLIVPACLRAGSYVGYPLAVEPREYQGIREATQTSACKR
ncbi:hypothetical protein J6590_010675 [Homalodisca vitripennis]|nr:hypothetical protein J6590_010675 [Homalodisca vitripennis]